MSIINPTQVPLVGVQFKTTIFKQGAQNDVVVFNDAGVSLFSARLATGAAAGATRSTIVTGASSTTAATTTIAYVSGTANARKSGNYYVKIGEEIVYVGKDSGYTTTNGNLTGCVRGCLGTTAAVHVATTTCQVLNSFVLGDSQTSLVEFLWSAYPPDPKGVDFAI